MKSKLLLTPFLSLGLLLSSLIATAQLSISWPENRLIFQRVNGTASVKIIITSTDGQPINGLQLRAYKLLVSGGQTAALDPRNGSSVGGDGFFTVPISQGAGTCQVTSQLTIQEGAYLLSARDGNNTARSASNNNLNFGVGDVYAIAGQSNAAGYSKGGSNAYYTAAESDPFIQFHNEKTGFDHGNDPEDNTAGVQGKNFQWYWGELGRQLKQSQNVPIAFYQNAVSSTSVAEWVYSATQDPNVKCANTGAKANRFGDYYPYKNLGDFLKGTAKKTGLKAILWHQGESDNANGVPLFCNTDQYNDHLNRLIGVSRGDLGGEVPWMIARVSYTNTSTSSDGAPYQPIINAQNRVIGHISGGLDNTDAKAYGDPRVSPYNRQLIFTGPNTDNYGASFRLSDHTHFNSTGQGAVASAWYSAMTTTYTGGGTGNNNNFLGNASPVANQGVVSVPGSNCAPSPYYLNVANNPNLQSLPSAGGNIGLTLTSNVTWSTTESLSWASVTPSGNGNGTPVIVFDANTGPSRSGTITISGSNGVASITLTITQQGAGTQPTSGSCYEAENASGNRGVISDGGASGGAYSGGYGNASEYSQFSVNANSGSNTLSISYSSSENPTLSLIVDGNSQSVNLTSNGHWGSPFSVISVPITFGSGSTHTIRIQGASSGAFNLDKICLGGGTTTSYYLTTANTGNLQSVSSAGGNVSFAINSNVSWTISESLSWASVTPSGNGNGNPVVTFDQNTGAARSGNLTISGSNGVSAIVLTVSQQASGGTQPTSGSCYEAENASGNRGVISDGGASGGAYSGGYGNASEYSQFSVNANSGSNTLSISYSSSENPTLSLIVDGNSQSVNLTSNGHWGSPFSVISVPITFGSGSTHTIRIQGASSGAFNLDKICLQSGSGRLGSVEPGTAINELVTISPNPASSVFTVTLPVDLGEKATVKVRNLLGQEMASRSVIGEGRPHVIEFSATNWLGGLYLINVTVGEQALDKRLLIIR